MPQTLEEFVRGTPFALELERLRMVEKASADLLDAVDSVPPGMLPRWAALAWLRELVGRKAVG
ncbi:MAG: hypothetical protein ACJ8GN_01995 [Longimicrobiaceae bacterium]